MSPSSAEFDSRLTILAIIVTREDPSEAVRSLERQTVKPDRIVTSDHRFSDPKTGTRVAKSINRTLSEVPWRDYDYLLRLDGDASLPADFIELALGERADLVGTGGSGLLFRRQVLEAFGSRWPVLDPEDSYFIWKARRMGFTHSTLGIRGTGRPFGGEYTVPRFLSWGYNCYILGIEPVSFLRLALISARAARRPAFVLGIPAYLGCILVGVKRLDIAEYVTRTQIRLLSRGLRKMI
jgi:hypothetical protein